ncbi:MAG TPA: hypothetical protein VEK11_26100 [Thermoanaerobaculia bacterium]|nr:hypothetical protein [Thermoanaerobaculia bacterium]
MHALALVLALVAEVPLTSPTLGPAALTQYGAVAASDGDNYLVLWEDGRGMRGQTRATRLTREGDVLDPTGVVLPEALGASVVWTGNSYLVAWPKDNATWGMRLDRDARIVDGPRVLIAAAAPSSVVVKDSQVIIGYQTETELRAAFFDANAQPLTDVRLAPHAPNRYSLRITPANDGFAATWLTIVVPYVSGEAHTTLEGVRFDRNGVSGETRVLIGEPMIEDVTVASDGDAFVVVARDASNLLNARAVSADLRTVGTRHTLPEPIVRYASLLWNGSHYVVIGDANTALRAQRLNRDATPAESMAFEEPPFSGTDRIPRVATNGRDLLVTWSSAHGSDSPTSLDVYGTIIDASSFAQRRREVLSLSAPRQTRPMLVSGDTNTLAVWSENGDVWAKRVDANGNPIDPAAVRVHDGAFHVTVAFNGAGYVISWFDFFAKQIVTRRVPRDGALRVEDVARIPAENAASLAIASNGTVTLLAWHEYEKVRVLRVGLDATPTTVTEALVGRVDVAANGTDQFLVVWHTESESYGTYLPFTTPDAIRGARITNTLVTLDGNGFDIARGEGIESDPVGAWNGREWLVLWSRDYKEVRARRVGANGTLVDSESLVTRNARLPDAVWDGARYVISWVEYAAMQLHVAWLTEPGTALFGERVLATVDGDYVRSAIAPVRPGTFLAAYSRIAEGPQIGGVARAFVTLQGEPVLRRRAVR